MNKIAATIAHWFSSNDLNPRDFTIVIRAKTERAAADLDLALARSEFNGQLAPLSIIPDIHKYTMNGIDFVVTSIDASAKV